MEFVMSFRWEKLKKFRIFRLSIVKKTLFFLHDFFWLIASHVLINDKLFLSFKYFITFHKRLNWKTPQTFNEKLQYLKLYCHKPVYAIMADKYRVKQFVSEKIGSQYVVPCLGVWEHAEDIDFTSLPQQFALKCNHNSGKGRCICKDKTQLNLEQVRKDIASGLKEDYYLPGRDKQYRDIPKKILAEQFLDDNTGNELRDYKFWCFSGVPTYMYCTNKGENVYENFYDMEFNPVPINHGFSRISPELTKPNEFELMKNLAARLSQGLPFVRVDFFNVNHHVYFSEFTFFDWGGFRPFEGNWDYALGKLITLPSIGESK